jgi:hypothetical protein
MNSAIKILVCSDTDYEQLIAEIYIDNKFVALVSQDNGVNDLQVEFPGCDQNQDAVGRKFDFNLFRDALERARTELIGPGATMTRRDGDDIQA